MIGHVWFCVLDHNVVYAPWKRSTSPLNSLPQVQMSDGKFQEHPGKSKENLKVKKCIIVPAVLDCDEM
jgi:hypothetical protein